MLALCKMCTLQCGPKPGLKCHRLAPSISQHKEGALSAEVPTPPFSYPSRTSYCWSLGSQEAVMRPGGGDEIFFKPKCVTFSITLLH